MLLGEELEAGATWSSPATSTPQLKGIQTPSRGCSHTSAVWMELIQHFSSFLQLRLIPGLRASPQAAQPSALTSTSQLLLILLAPNLQQPRAGLCRAGNPKC